MRQMGSNSIMPRSMDLRKIEKKKIGGNLQIYGQVLQQ